MATDCSSSPCLVGEPLGNAAVLERPGKPRPHVRHPEPAAPATGKASGSMVAEVGAVEIGEPSASRSVAFWRDLIELSKPRIVTMILVTTLASAWIAASTSPQGVSLAALQWLGLLLGTALVAGSAGAANQVWERRIDRLMPRTASRPIPAGRVGTVIGVLATAVSGLTGVALLGWMFSTAESTAAEVLTGPAGVAAATWLVYVLVYTPMKTRTAWNTTVGAIAGALPIFIGYRAAGGQWSELGGWMTFGILAAWQYPHFMAIAWLYRRQYAEAGFKMTTTVDPSGRQAAWQSILGALGLIACGLVLCVAPASVPVWSAASVLTSVLVIAAGWPMVAAGWRFASSPTDQTARRMLRWSLVVLPVVLLVVTFRVVLSV